MLDMFAYQIIAVFIIKVKEWSFKFQQQIINKLHDNRSISI